MTARFSTVERLFTTVLQQLGPDNADAVFLLAVAILYIAAILMGMNGLSAILGLVIIIAAYVIIVERKYRHLYRMAKLSMDGSEANAKRIRLELRNALNARHSRASDNRPRPKAAGDEGEADG